MTGVPVARDILLDLAGRRLRQFIRQLEAYGFCGFGEPKDFIADRHIELGGTLPPL